MKIFVQIIISCWLTLSLLLCGCKMDTSHNGDLDGYWKLTSIDSLTLGITTDYTDRSIFWAVQKDLINVRDNAGGNEYVFRFEQTDSSLTVYNGQLYDKLNGNVMVEEMLELAPFGINSQPAFFVIDHLSSRRMSIHDDLLRLNFKKM